MVKRLGALILATAVILLACVQTGPAPGEGAPETGQKQELEVFDPATYTREMMLEDYDFFWTTLEENCATFGLIEQATRINLEQIKQEYWARIATAQDGEAETFVRIMSDLSREFGSFAHICVVEPVSYYRTMDGETWESTTKKELYESEQVQAFYRWQTDLPYYRQQLESMQQASELKENGEGQPVNSVIEENIQLSRQGDIAVVRLKSLYFYGEELNQVIIEKLRTFCRENLDAQHFIIDITGNSGGSTHIWSEGLDPLWAGKTIPYQMVAAYKLGSVNVQMWDGALKSTPYTELKPLAFLNTVKYPKLDMQSLEGCDGVAEQITQYDYTDVTNPGGKEFEGQVWILTDGRVASSAEILAQFGKKSDFCTLVGTQTRGMGGVIVQPATMVATMPNCGMLMQYAPFYFINEDGTCLDVEGTHPDIEIGPEEDPMARCLQEIAKLG